MEEEIEKAKGWKHKRLHRMATSRSKMRDVGLLVVLNWQYLSE